MIHKQISFLLFVLVLFFASSSIADTTNYEYDDLHRLTRVERSDGTVTVYEYDDLGNRTRMLVTSNSNITALFTASPTSGVYPLAVDFTDQSIGDITSWLWNFGDGQTSTEQNPSHTYNAPGIYTVSLNITGPGGSDTEIKTDYILVENVEDFETGDLSKFPWITSGDGLWAVTNTNPHSGSYAAESPSIGDSESAAIETTLYCQEGEVSFWYSVSSEENWDYLYFYVDDELQGAWSGSVAYTQANYPVSSGVHSFEWVYEKDGSVSNGSDAAWLDDISFPGTVGTDSDGDGLTDELENSMCTDPYDADTDDDGISDGVEDGNHNGVVDYGETDPCDIDTDDDGIQDGTELGYTLYDIGPDTDTNIFQPDLDPSTTTDPLDDDTDNDGLLDGEEDTNHNGEMDEGETDSSDNDTDSDGILDGFDNCPNTYNPDQADSDGDGVGNVCDDDNIEDFETGDLSKFPWVTTGDGLWDVTSTYPLGGSYATESPSIGDNESATIETTLYCDEGEITFWYAVSSEENEDYLYFYVDDELEGVWSGSVAYTRATYTVTPGTHIFEWVYEKDESGSAGSDAVWLDNISFPVSEVPIVIEDFETGDLNVLPWTTSGDGDWDVTSTYPHRGSYAAESPSIGDNESATIETTVYCDEGEMSFWYSVSSEENGDYLYFYVDDELQGAWSGSVAYTHTNYMVPSGAHSFKWVYAKDGSGSDGSDAAWLDDISFPGTVTTDSDGDGLTDELENTTCTDPYDADTDDDGISDGVEDANHNGVMDYGETDPCNIDTDGDGIQDGTELGYTLADIGPDTDTDIFQPDLDPSTTTDPLNSDTDGDGLSDGQEDTNHDGAVNNGEKDPTQKDNTFGPDSADITNPFFPINTVKKLIYAGYGALDGYERYMEVVGTEVIDNVNCVKVLIKGYGNNPDPELDPEWYYSWVAQDTDEVVWVLQRYIAEEDTTEFFGKDNAVVLMPADPVIGQTYNHIESEYSQITDTGVTVPELNTGVGPYTNCIKTMWTDGISDVDFEYHAPDVGPVKLEWDGITKGWELKEIIYYSSTKDELAIDFKTTGIYVYNTGIWNRIYQGVDPEGLCSFGTYLAADFGTTYGLYVYDAGAWTRVYKGVAIEKMAGFGGKLAVDFGTSYPIYEYNYATDTWNPIYNYSSPRDTMEALGDKLVVDFKTVGIYVYDAGSWNRIYRGVDPVNIVSFGDKLAVDFGTAYGLYVYEYDTDNWTRVYKGVAIEKMAEIDGDLAVNFGTAYGLYVYEFDTDNWTRVYKGVAIEKMAGFDGNLAVDFGTTYPIYEYDFDTDNWNSIYQYSSPRDELVPANILD